MRRGDIVIARSPGTFVSKARPCLIVQSDGALPANFHVTICPLTSVLRGLDRIRVTVPPSQENGLKQPSEIEIDLVTTVPVSAIVARVGQADAMTMEKVDAALRRWLDL